MIGECYRWHRSKDFRRPLDRIEAAVPTRLDVLILDNCETHKPPAIRRRLLRHQRFHVHFTPTHVSWINLVGRWFAALTEKQIRRGVHRSTSALETAIRDYIASNNEEPAPFAWPRPPTKSSI